jgi:rubrerythrin
MRHPKPTPEGKKALEELDKMVERHRDIFEKLAESYMKKNAKMFKKKPASIQGSS